MSTRKDYLLGTTMVAGAAALSLTLLCLPLLLLTGLSDALIGWIAQRLPRLPGWQWLAGKTPARQQ